MSKMRLWRGVAITALGVLATSLVVGLLWFFADPLNLPPELLSTLDQRAGVLGMLTGTGIGVAGVVVALLALRGQTRANRAPSAALAPPDAPAVESAPPPATGGGTRDVQMRAHASGQARIYQSGGDQTIHEDHRRP